MTRAAFIILLLTLSACTDFGNRGTYQVFEETGTEGCGGPYGAYGYIKEDVTNVLFSSDDSESTSDIDSWLGFWQVWFDTGYLTEGTTLNSSNSRALCSRLSAPNDGAYLTFETADFEVELITNKGIISDEINGDVHRWKIAWRIDCDAFEMHASGVDDVDLDPNGPNFPDLPSPPSF